MPVYKCPKCGRTVELPEGKYYCKVCGPSTLMVRERVYGDYVTVKNVHGTFVVGEYATASYSGVIDYLRLYGVPDDIIEEYYPKIKTLRHGEALKIPKHHSNPQTVKALIEDEFELKRLFKLQDILIEHKFPSNHIAIHEYLISCAGDIYREMTHKTPYFKYIDEKWRALMKYCYRLGGLTKEDYEELAMLMREPYYKPRRDEYLRNLERLKAETIKARIDEKRKSVMLAALNMIEGLIRWFESLDPYKYPKAEMDALTDAIANYFPEQFYE